MTNHNENNDCLDPSTEVVEPILYHGEMVGQNRIIYKKVRGDPNLQISKLHEDYSHAYFNTTEYGDRIEYYWHLRPSHYGAKLREIYEREETDRWYKIHAANEAKRIQEERQNRILGTWTIVIIFLLLFLLLFLVQ